MKNQKNTFRKKAIRIVCQACTITVLTGCTWWDPCYEPCPVVPKRPSICPCNYHSSCCENVICDDVPIDIN
ncbi:hypothetical protein BN1013_01112 [Candidatus Rubidus massiliensis]|nr:hypothetical protein BN1013_01112 [Candidatus Rubidus massiliensis]